MQFRLCLDTRAQIRDALPGANSGLAENFEASCMA